MAKSAPKRTAPPRRPPQGRPPGGLRPGDRVRDYPTLTVRVPPETRALLIALSKAKQLPLWQMIRHLTICFVRGMVPRERRSVLRRARQELAGARSRPRRAAKRRTRRS